MATKVAAYKAVILTTLQYGCESWTAYRRHITKLDQFHIRCLRKIAHIKWQDLIPNTTVLERCQINGIESYLIAAQFRWTSHVIRMDDYRIPKQIFYGQLAKGSRYCGGQFKRYKDTLKSNLKSCGIPSAELETRASDRPTWRTTCREAIDTFESNRLDQLKEKRQTRKQQPTTNAASFSCDICRRTCGSRIGLFAHRSHR